MPPEVTTAASVASLLQIRVKRSWPCEICELSPDFPALISFLDQELEESYAGVFSFGDFVT